MCVYHCASPSPTQEHVERALEVFNTAVEDTLPAADKDEQAKADIEAAIAKARDEVMRYVHKALDLVEQKVDALAKTQEAEALEAERRKLMQHIQQEQELYRLKQDILVDYKAQMQDKQAGFTSVLEAEREHKVCMLLCPALSKFTVGVDCCQAQSLLQIAAITSTVVL